jgi:hypothetical protein
MKNLPAARRVARRAVLAIAVAACGACSTGPAEFAGIWKVACDDYWGVRIAPAAAAGWYSVTFCGLSGCLPAGEWMPDTRIAADPLYQRVSAGTLGIRHGERGYTTYSRCSANPA